MNVGHGSKHSYRATSRSRSAAFLVGVVFVCLNLATSVYAQTVESLSQVRKLYVDSLGQGKIAADLRGHVISRLRHSHGIEVVQNLPDADAVAKGTGQIWTTSRSSLSPRSNSARQATVEGFLSLEVIGKNNQTLWSYLVTPSKFSWGGIEDDLARQVVAKLLADIAEKGHPTDTSAASAIPAAQTALNGAGATFPAPLYQKWFESFQQEHPNVKIAYDAVGSGEGIRRLKAGQIDFGASEMPLSDQDISGGNQRFTQVPIVLGAVVPIYSLRGVHQNLNMSPEILAGIYLGKIRKWNDPQIRALNSGTPLPDAEIAVVHRSDASGTSFVWSEYLSKASPGWKTSVGSGVNVPWPVGIGAERNEGVAATVQRTPNSIGYVEFIYAIQHELRFASVRNAAGQFIKADIASVREASASAGQPDRGFRFSITAAPGRTAYPIATYTWLLLPDSAEDKNKRAALRELVRWMLSSGQKSCSALGYAPLPTDVAQRALQSIGQ
jgi:phosphate ABC transporter phosphate-binding protein